MVVGGGGRRLETTEDYRGQFLRTDFGPCRESGPLTTPAWPLKLRLFGDKTKQIYVYVSIVFRIYTIYIYI